jgi:hypothetical protein
MATTKKKKPEPKPEVFHNGDGRYFVENETGQLLYKVAINNGHKSCTCPDFTQQASANPEYACKHLEAVIGANGNAMYVDAVKPKLDERFITTIEKKGEKKEFVVYAGLLDLAHQKGLKALIIEVVQFPTKDNGKEAICKAMLESRDGEEFIDYGDAGPGNVTSYIVPHLLRMASTRAKARVLRDFTNIGMTCLEELGDMDGMMFDDPKPGSLNEKGADKKSAPKTRPKEHNTSGGDTNTKPKERNTSGGDSKISDAQMKAILNIAKRKGMSEDDVKKEAESSFGVDLGSISSKDASSFIESLQQSS